MLNERISTTDLSEAVKRVLITYSPNTCVCGGSNGHDVGNAAKFAFRDLIMTLCMIINAKDQTFGMDKVEQLLKDCGV